MKLQDVKVKYHKKKKRYYVNLRSVVPSIPGKKEKFFHTENEGVIYLKKQIEQLPIFYQDKLNYTMDDLYLEYKKEYLTDGDNKERFLKRNRMLLLNDMKVGSKRLGNFLVRDVETALLQKYVMDVLKVGRTKRTVRKYHTDLGQLFDLAMQESICRYNPVRVAVGNGYSSSLKIKGEKTTRGKANAALIYPEKIKRMIDAMPNIYWKAAMAFAAFTGARQGEQRALVWGDIDFQHSVVRIQSTVYTESVEDENGNCIKRPFAIKHKTKAQELREDAEPRIIDLVPDLVRFLKEHKVSSNFIDDTDLIWPSSTGHIVSGRVFGDQLTPACARAGVDKITWHYLRHHYASILISQNFRDVDIMDLMGHSDIKTTRTVYGHWMKTPVEREKRKQKLNTVFSYDNPLEMEQQKYNFIQK